MTARPRIPGTKQKGPVLFILREIDDDLEPAKKNALAARNVCSLEGRCPVCGTVGVIHEDADYPGIFHWVFEHENYCPVVRDAA
jgi:hypothetical protein